jgi:hypothetical protein
MRQARHYAVNRAGAQPVQCAPGQRVSALRAVPLRSEIWLLVLISPLWTFVSFPTADAPA